MNMISKQFAVPEDLKPWLNSIWYCAGDGPETEVSPIQNCLPTGMAELIFHLTPQRHFVHWKGNWQALPDTFLVGVQTENINWKMYGGTILMGVSIKPEAFSYLFNRPIGEWANDYAEIQTVLGNELNHLVTTLKDAPAVELAGLELIRFFREKVQQSAPSSGPDYFPDAVRLIRSSIGRQKVDEVCGQVFVGKRQLQRVFQDHIGVSPKTYGRIVRFRGAFDFFMNRPGSSWADVTYQFGYADQAHFIRDFKAFTGVNPTKFWSLFRPLTGMPFAMNI